MAKEILRIRYEPLLHNRDDRQLLVLLGLTLF